MDRFNNLEQRLPFENKRLATKILISYILDYAIVILFIIGFLVLDKVEPFHQHFSLRNYTLQYPYKAKDTISIGLAAFLAVVVPAIIIAIFALVIDGFFSHKKPSAEPQGRSRIFTGRYSWKSRVWELNAGILGLLLSTSLTFVITNAMKNATGKPRPDFVARCLPVAGAADAPVFGLSNSTICTQTDHAILKDGFRSFPSGHSSTSFGGLFFLSLYLAGKLHIWDTRGQTWKAFVVAIPSLGAALIAISRIEDARHHPFDVLFGSFLGIIIAWGSYRQYFPALSEPWKKGRAHPLRTWAQEPTNPADGIGKEPMRRSGTSPSGPDEEQGDLGYTANTATATRRKPMPGTEDTTYYGSSSPYAAGVRHPRPEGDYVSSSSDGHDRSFEMQPQPHGQNTGQTAHVSPIAQSEAIGPRS